MTYSFCFVFILRTSMFCFGNIAWSLMHYLHNKICLSQELANLDEVELIQNDGSPCGSKYFLLWNPPLYMADGNSKASSVPRRSRYGDICSFFLVMLFVPFSVTILCSNVINPPTGFAKKKQWVMDHNVLH